MPYISDESRLAIAQQGGIADNPGQLNYLLTRTILEYMARKGKSYQTINDISGALTECLAEFRRRITVEYETGKAHTNGDVYRHYV